LKELNLDYSKRQLKLLNIYISEIELWNPRYGLVNAKGDMLVIKHILDSLTGVKIVKSFNKRDLADVGSGAGLPGIPLAIMMPELKVTLIERSGKRVRFLRSIKAMLALDNLSICEMDLKDVKTKYDLVTFRAFKPVEPEIMKLLMRILDKNGKMIAYKGKKENVKMEMDMVKDIASVENIFPVFIPGINDERTLVVYRS
ncbi:MAG: 16S rRNA (guanine(527)-N(7))-methyltransferase RsmG, partial [Deltaproteobacteria bacterium]|nr:16S rRNA (guanine(527)-N(7))-methyltransferase RsmG [Deltaproteobacteria bacterium]